LGGVQIALPPRLKNGMFEVFANSKNPSEIGRHLQWIILTICESTQDFRKEQVQRSKSLATRQLLVRAAAL